MPCSRGWSFAWREHTHSSTIACRRRRTRSSPRPSGRRCTCRSAELLASRTAPAELEEKIFEIVNQLDRGAALVDSPGERERIAELNLMAGKRAKASTAYASALSYLAAGRALLADDSWKQHYRLTFELEYHRAECEFLTGDLAAAEQRLAMLSRRAANLVDLSAVTCRARGDVYTTMDRPDRAVEVGLEYLRRIGVAWSAHPTDEEVEREYEQIWHQLGSRAIEELIDLPPDERFGLARDHRRSTPSSYRRRYSPTIICTVSSSAAWRISASSMATATDRASPMPGSACCSGHASAITPPGFASASSACDLVEQRGLIRFQARVYLVFAYVVPWRSPWHRPRPAAARIRHGAGERAILLLRPTAAAT